jgi:hypothetical protein
MPTQLRLACRWGTILDSDSLISAATEWTQEDMKLTRIAATAAAIVAVATFAFHGVTNAEGAPKGMSAGSYPQGPTRYTASGVPEYGMVGQGVWQEAAVVNLGDPSIRIVYDQTIPGAHDQAMAYYNQLAAAIYAQSQPGVTTGLQEVAHTANFEGVQFQLYDNTNAAGAQWADQQYIKIFASYGITFIPGAS